MQLLRPLMAGASPSFLLIEVSGTIDHPTVRKTAFPVLNETLRELFPDLAEAREARLNSRSGGVWRR